MKNIRLRGLRLQNFKGCTDVTAAFGGNTATVYGANATGKTSLVDAFLWLMFDKDSSDNSKFGIRPVDKDGKEIDNIEISVTGKFQVDETEIEFKKTQKQKWTKHRGSSEAVFEGNVNSFEIDGFPQSKAEYTAKVAELIPEETFRLVADLRYFSNLDWKDKRKLLLSLCGDVTDLDVFAGNPDYWHPIKADVEAAGADKAREKAKKALRELNQRMSELPIRIDEASKQYAEMPDIEAMQKQKADYEKQIEEMTAEIESVSGDDACEIQRQLHELEMKRAELFNKATVEINNAYDRKKRECREYRQEVYEADKDEMSLILARQKLDTKRRELQAELDHLSVIYHNNEKAVTFDERMKMCNYCGQILPKDKIDEIVRLHNEREEERKAKLTKAVEDGRQVRQQIMEIDAKIKEVAERAEKAAEKAKVMKQNLDTMEKAVSEIGITIDTKRIPGYEKLSDEIHELIGKKKKAEERETEITALSAKVNEIREDIVKIDNVIAGANAIVRANDEVARRIEELKEEQRETGQKIAEAEQKLILLEEFSMKKSELLSQKIQSCFKLANFSLFSRQINGGLVEECEITYNGVKYKDLNSGHRIIVAMDIIRSFSEKIGVCAPLFIDNAESVNDFNLPEMPCQLILLKVSDDKKLEIEGGEIHG